MLDHEYEFIINGKTEVFFTNESRIQFWNSETDEEIFSIDPTDLEVVNMAYNHVMALWARQDAEDYAREELVH